MNITKAEAILKPKENIVKEISSSTTVYQTKTTHTTDSNKNRSILSIILEIIMKIQLNLNNKTAESFSIYEGQTSKEIAEGIAQKYALSVDIKNRIQIGIQNQLENI